MLVIGIIGPKASGKETIANYIAGRYNGKSHSHSEILDDILSVLDIPNTRQNEIKLVALRKTFGPNVLTNALNKKIKAEDVSIQAITGIRFDSEYENIRSYPHNAVIYVDAPIEQRYQWQLKRGQKNNDAKMSFEEFQGIEQMETEVNIVELGKKADFKIQNRGSTEQLYAQIDAIMKQILK